jgi:hypothetical protein
MPSPAKIVLIWTRINGVHKITYFDSGLSHDA